MLSLSFSYLLQGVLLVQTTNYVMHAWRVDALVTRSFISLVLLLSLVHSVLLLLSVSLNVAPLSAASILNAKLVSIAAQCFFALRVYHLPWRYDFLFLPLVFLLVGSFGTSIGSFIATPGTDISHKLVIVSSVFPFLLSAWSAGCILGHHLTAPISPKQTLMPRPHLILHSALPGTLILLLALSGAAAAPGLNAVAVHVAGYVQAICALWVLENRQLRIIGSETNTEVHKPLILKDLLWTRVQGPPSATIPHRVALLPLHRGSMRNQDAALAPVTGSDKSFWFSHAFALNNDEHSNIKSPGPLDNDPFFRPNMSPPPVSRGPSLDRSYSIKSMHSSKSPQPDKMADVRSTKSLDTRSAKRVPRSIKSAYSNEGSILPPGSIPIALEAGEDVEAETAISHNGHSPVADTDPSNSPSGSSLMSSLIPTPAAVPVAQPAAVYVSRTARPSAVTPSMYTVEVTPRAGTPIVPSTPRRSISTQRSLLSTTSRARSNTINVSSPARSPSSSERLHAPSVSSLPKRAPAPSSFVRPPPTPHSRSGSGLTFMPPGLYDPREFQAIRGNVEGGDGEAV